MKDHTSACEILDTGKCTCNDRTIIEKALRVVLKEREEELLELKGPCSNGYCELHYAHRGPCNENWDEA